MDFYLERALKEIESTTRGMDLEQRRAHPPGKWCAAEILEHLALTFSSTAKLLERCLQSGKPAARRPTLRERVITFVVVTLGFFPSGRPAPDFATPRGLDPALVQEAIRNSLVAMDGKITECERRFGAVKIANHPVLGPFTAREWRRFHWVHTRHHIKQIARLRLLIDPS
jgi:hypothetical protein